MNPITLSELPSDLLLFICEYLRPEDRFSLIQTCKALHNLTEIRVFWIHLATRLQKRRRVHHLPLEQVPSLELRSSILRTLKLDLKWSLKPNVDHKPRRVVELDTTPFQPKISSDEKPGGVTWAWFLEDGKHIICVIEDVLIQLWDLTENRVVVRWDAGGQLVRASKYIDAQYFVVAASVSQPGVEEGNEPVDLHYFKIWRYEWSSNESEDLQPYLVVPIPIDGTFTFISHSMTGIAYVAEQEELLTDVNQNFNFLVVQWRESTKLIRCHTPLTAFGEKATNCLNDRFRMTRSPKAIYMHFESTDLVETFSYDLSVLENLLKTRGGSMADDPPARVVLYPTSQVTYRFIPEDTLWLPTSFWGTWGDSCLWDGKRVGLLSQNVKFHAGETHTIVALSVLDLDVEDTPIGNDQITPHLHAEFTRPVIYVQPKSMNLSVTDYHVLVSQPSGSKNVVWALTSLDSPNQIEALVLAQFPPEHSDDDEMTIDSSVNGVASETLSNDAPESVNDDDEEEGTDEDAGLEDNPVQPKGHILTIDVKGFLPDEGQAVDIDLDDTRGKVAFGMQDGKVIILEFV